MAKTKKNTKSNSKKVREQKYNAENEIIIGVNTIKKEQRVENKKSTRKKYAKKYSNKNSKMDLSKDDVIKHNNKKKRIIGCILCLIILVSGIIFLTTTPRFYIQNIEIEGNNKNSIETYISLTKIELDTTNIFSISKKNIIRNIKENKYVEDVEVKRKLPSTLQINIKEREIAYQIKYDDKYIYIDKQGYILEVNSERKKVIEIIGFDVTKEEEYKENRLNNEDLEKLDIVIKIINQCKYNSIKNDINSINITDKLNIIVNIDNGQKIAYLGDASKLSERILWLKTILEKEKNNNGEIFINGNINDSKVYFKPKVEK